MGDVTTLSVTDTEVAARVRQFRDERELTTTEAIAALLSEAPEERSHKREDED